MVITQESFQALLEWLDPDRDAAGQKYEVIRSGLIRMFVSKGFSDAEDLADLTINRIINRLPDIREGYRGEPANYFHGVARNIVREAWRRKEITVEAHAVSFDGPPERGDDYECLRQCLKLLPPEKRDLILDYYLYKGRDKIERRKLQAKQLGLSEGALRTRAHHIRASLQKCVLQCVKRLTQKQNVRRNASLNGDVQRRLEPGA